MKRCVDGIFYLGKDLIDAVLWVHKNREHAKGTSVENSWRFLEYAIIDDGWHSFEGEEDLQVFWISIDPNEMYSQREWRTWINRIHKLMRKLNKEKPDLNLTAPFPPPYRSAEKISWTECETDIPITRLPDRCGISWDFINDVYAIY